ncbi:efflux RND transporter periplasmic adaptor subunit [Sphaerotilus sp.]|uniref:efflux RND transporter periplasmic adaptor subunit n=1 Tax=Sphaerotilus sp. TaxID=2093942 RepID=UPI002ACEEBF3|nr:efflux RND transporter periplasmic adaptor subunit [Sphaerotilus sp.]MDZ7855470.1 efflux RND transporter periplasmic adaptor subunit [Sphaerotilus sp.]
MPSCLFKPAQTLTLTLALLAAVPTHAADAPASAAPKPALTVSVTTPQSGTLPQSIAANGSIAAWQEVVIGAETQGLRLVEVNVQVGDRVKKGQLLARLQSDTLAADLAATQAGLAEAEATLAEAQANAERARALQPSGALSAQQIQQYTTGEATARARLQSLKARLAADTLRLNQTRLKAPDDGIISARLATMGAIAQPGQELFRLIRQGRLEWRAEVPAAELHRLQPGMAVKVVPAGGSAVSAKVRLLAPTVDPVTRNGLVYVDLPAGSTARSGMFARGEFVLGESSALTLPQTAVVLRDGYSYVFRLVQGNRVQQTKVQVGRRLGDRVEVTSGLDAAAQVVAQGGGFLADGDVVKVVKVVTP